LDSKDDSEYLKNLKAVSQEISSLQFQSVQISRITSDQDTYVLDYQLALEKLHNELISYEIGGNRKSVVVALQEVTKRSLVLYESLLSEIGLAKET